MTDNDKKIDYSNFSKLTPELEKYLKEELIKFSDATLEKKSLSEYARTHEELRDAIKKWGI
jgi:transposase